jgi:hypothetical protein
MAMRVECTWAMVGRLLGWRRAAGYVGAAEVDELAGVSQLRAFDQDVARLEIPVHDAQVMKGS